MELTEIPGIFSVGFMELFYQAKVLHISDARRAVGIFLASLLAGYFTVTCLMLPSIYCTIDWGDFDDPC